MGQVYQPYSTIRTTTAGQLVFSNGGSNVIISNEPQPLQYVISEAELNEPIPEQPKYDDWVVPLLTHQYLQEFLPLAVEYRVVDLKNSIGGTLDAYGIDTRTNKKVLMDLKTQSNPNANAYNTNEQLGAYYSMLSSNGIQVDECRTVWCRPNKTVVGEYQDPAQCYSDWVDKLDIWKMYQEEF